MADKIQPIEKQRKHALSKARVASSDTTKKAPMATSTFPPNAQLRVARNGAKLSGSEQIRPMRIKMKESSAQKQARIYQSNLNAVRAQEAAQAYRRNNSTKAIERKLSQLPPCRRSIFIFAYTLMAINLYLAFLKTIFLAASDLATDLVGNASLLIPFVGLVAKIGLETLGLAAGWVIAIVISVMQFAIAIYLYLFMRKRTTLAKRKMWNIGVVVLSILPLVDMIPWVLLRLSAIKKEEKANCRKRAKLEAKL